MRLGWVSAADRLDKSAVDKVLDLERFRVHGRVLNAQPAFAKSTPWQALNVHNRTCSRKPARRQTGAFYILCLRDFEILGARDVKRDEGERLIFLAAYSASGHSSPWMTADSPRKVSIGPPSLH
jgi:hypothetical protein